MRRATVPGGACWASLQLFYCTLTMSVNYIAQQVKRPSLLIALLSWAAVSAQGANGLTLNWSNNLLTVSGPAFPGGKLEIWYLEAFCRKGSTQRDWSKTVLPHKTELITAEPEKLRFRTTIEPNALMLHQVQASSSGIDFQFTLKNQGQKSLDLEWFQPACIRVDRFTGM